MFGLIVFFLVIAVAFLIIWLFSDKITSMYYNIKPHTYCSQCGYPMEMNSRISRYNTKTGEAIRMAYTLFCTNPETGSHDYKTWEENI